MQRLWLILGAISALALAGCAQTLVKPNELHAALLYAPQPSDAPVSAQNLAASAPCDASVGVRPPTGRQELGDDFAALPGMTLQVTQANARLTGASDAPMVTSWSWTIPQSVGSPCGTTNWSQRDLLVVRTLLYGARLGTVTMPPDKGSAFDPLLWALAVRCASVGAATAEDGKQCLTDAAPPRQPSSQRLQANLLDPFVTRLRVTIGNGGALPTGAAGAASALADRESIVEADFPSGPSDPRVRCAQPQRWYGKDRTTDPIPAPCDDAFKILRLRGMRSAIPVLKCPPPDPKPGTEPECYLTLLETGDRLQLNGPKLIGSMVSPAFDLGGPRPGSGYDYDTGETDQPVFPKGSQRTIAGEAYQGFVDFELLIPVWIEGGSQPLLVPVDTTLAALQSRIGGTIVGVKRLAGWFPASVTTAKKAPFTPKAHDGRVTIGLGPRGPGQLRTQTADWANDMLVAPGDIVMVK